MAAFAERGKFKMKLSEPRPKKHCKLKPSLPLPLLKDANNEFHKFKGKFIGYTVVVEEENEMKQLVSNGYFGKGNFSRSFPTFSQKKGQTEILRRRQFERRKQWGKKYGDQKKSKKCIVVPDSDEENDDYFKNLKPQYEVDCSQIKEKVHLFLEEAFFLQKFVECLDISHRDSILTPEQTWELFKENDSHFVPSYVAYHYYRSRNWVVKPGIKFGGDFLIYKQGPPFYHASHVIIIDVVDQQMNVIETMKRRNMDVVSIQGLNRLCEAAGKELLMCKVIWPSGVINVQIDDIPKFEVKEVLMKRWLPSVERNPVEYD